MIWFKVEGRPVAKARPRVLRNGIVYTPKTTKEYESRILASWAEQSGNKVPEGGVAKMSITFNFGVLKSASQRERKELLGRPYDKRPDIDNLVKAVMDALNGYAFTDDSCIYLLTAHKQYSAEESTEVYIDW